MSNTQINEAETNERQIAYIIPANLNIRICKPKRTKYKPGYCWDACCDFGRCVKCGHRNSSGGCYCCKGKQHDNCKCITYYCTTCTGYISSDENGYIGKITKCPGYPVYDPRSDKFLGYSDELNKDNIKPNGDKIVYMDEIVTTY
jgi:hypothetical protein